MALRHVRLSKSGARILKMLSPFPWEPGGWASGHTSVLVEGTTVEWEPAYDGTILAQSSPGIGFPRGDAAKIRAAIASGRSRRRSGNHSHPAHPYSHPVATKHRRR